MRKMLGLCIGMAGRDMSLRSECDGSGTGQSLITGAGCPMIVHSNQCTEDVHEKRYDVLSNSQLS